MKMFINIIGFVLLTLTLTSCELVEGIFKAGVWSGVIVVVLVIALVLWLIMKILGGNKD